VGRLRSQDSAETYLSLGLPLCYNNRYALLDFGCRVPRLLKIDNVMFFVADLEKAARFYEETLGLKGAWTDREREMVGFTFAQSNSEIVIHRDPTIPNPDFSFLVEDVEAFCDAYRSSGHAILVEPFDVRCGKFAVLADPDGNRISIVDLTRFGGKPVYDQ
jgi:catechol 2,3-dioxygenase-like lactoylglutathione lyase family enzyme